MVAKQPSSAECNSSAEAYVANEAGQWDQESLGNIRDQLKALAVSSNATSGEMFGPDHTALNYLYYLFGAATAWGGQSPEEAVYIFGPPDGTDTSGDVAYTITIPADLPLRRDDDGELLGFWSLTVYDAAGFLVPNDLGVYNFNDAGSKAEENGDVIITLAPEAECATLNAANCLPIPGDGWNYIVRLYVPGEEIVDGTYVFPAPVPME